jgi:hypothetical protein
MNFRQRLIAAATILICLPTAIWAVHDLAGLSAAAGGGPLSVYSPYEEDHHIPHGVSAGHLEPLAKYFHPDDHKTSFATGEENSSAIAHPHGKRACASGCALDQHPTPELLRGEFQRLLAMYAKEPSPADMMAISRELGLEGPEAQSLHAEQWEGLEKLLYFGRQTLLYLDQLGPGPLDKEHEDFLRSELYFDPKDRIDRLHVLVELRVIDEFGVVRLWNKPALVPLDVRFGFAYQNKDYQRIEESTGTVKRVGLYHLWQRI